MASPTSSTPHIMSTDPPLPRRNSPMRRASSNMASSGQTMEQAPQPWQSWSNTITCSGSTAIALYWQARAHSPQRVHVDLSTRATGRVTSSTSSPSVPTKRCPSGSSTSQSRSRAPAPDRARLTATVVLPVPPLPLATTTRTVTLLVDSQPAVENEPVALSSPCPGLSPFHHPCGCPGEQEPWPRVCSRGSRTRASPGRFRRCR